MKLQPGITVEIGGREAVIKEVRPADGLLSESATFTYKDTGEVSQLPSFMLKPVATNMGVGLSLEEQTQFEAYEVVIANGLQTFYEVGTALAEIRDNRLYRQQYRTFEEYVDQRWQMKRAHAYRLMDAAAVRENLSPIGDILPSNEAQVRPLTVLPPHEQQQAWQEAVDTAPNGKPTGEHVQRVVNQHRAHVSGFDPDDTLEDQLPPEEREYRQATTSVPYVAHNSGQNEWYTPPEIIEAARRVMGEITLDPASSAIANRVVGATYFYTLEDDGLKQDWTGCVWLNPPYSQPEIGEFAEKVYQEHQAVEQLCILVNNATETVWFQRLLEAADAVCLLRGRVRFLDTQLKPTGAPLQGQAVLYAGPNTNAFRAEFSRLGAILEPR